jgi:hypothetical protein
MGARGACMAQTPRLGLSRILHSRGRLCHMSPSPGFAALSH